MVSARLRPSHRIRRAGGPTRPVVAHLQPAPLTLADYFAAFDPAANIQLPQPVCPLRWRSAPWGDIIVANIRDTSESQDDQQSVQSYDSQDIDDSLQINLLAKKLPPPTHYTSVGVPHIPKTSALCDNAGAWTVQLIQHGAD
jgi:hypothetical protein